MTSQTSTGRGMVRGFLETDPSKDSAKEWDDKDHLAADIGGRDLFSELAVSYISTCTSFCGYLPIIFLILTIIFSYQACWTGFESPKQIIKISSGINGTLNREYALAPPLEIKISAQETIE